MATETQDTDTQKTTKIQDTDTQTATETQDTDLQITEHTQQTFEQLPIYSLAITLSLNQLQNAADCPRLHDAVCHDVHTK